MSSRRTMLSVAFTVVGAALPACDTPADPYWLTGAWRFDTGSEITLACPGLPDEATQSLEGVVTTLAETHNGLELDLGCSCRLQMTNDGRLATAGQDCKLVVTAGVAAYEVSAVVNAFTLTAPDGPDAAVRQAAVAGTAAPDRGLLTNCTFTIGGRLTRTEQRRPRCGATSTAVGVLPYHSNGLAPCPIGAGVDSLRIIMVDDNRTGCGATPGDVGEAPWTLPDTPRRFPDCIPSKANGSKMFVPLCKVDGQLFKAIAGVGRGNSYALLQLGDECPQGSVSVKKKIDNDDETTANDYRGDISPNQSSNGGVYGTVTVLNFCLFRGVQQEAPANVSFPELGFPYAVFHPFEGPQPSWVMTKRWMRSDDESSSSNGNEYTPSGGAAVEDLKTMILDAGTDTVFDMARVR